MIKMKTVSIIGLGYVGLPLACRCVSKGFDVKGADINKNKIKLIASGKSPIEDEKLEKKLKTTYSKMKLYSNYHFTLYFLIRNCISPTTLFGLLNR